MTGTTYGILVGYDGSDCGERALEWAIDEARMRRTRLTICHVWQYPYTGFMGGTVTVDFEREAKRILEAAVAQARLAAPDLEIQPLLGDAAGTPYIDLDGLRTFAWERFEKAVDRLLVLGSRGVGTVRGRLLGSVSQTMLHHAPCPVALVHAPESVPAPVPQG
jgi:nucleotide-binding universal stress UspA family protein